MVNAHDAEFDVFVRSCHVESRWTVVDFEALHGDVILCGFSRVSFSCFCFFDLAAFLCFGGGRGPFGRLGLTLRGTGSAFGPFSLPCGFVAFRLGFAR